VSELAACRRPTDSRLTEATLSKWTAVPPIFVHYGGAERLEFEIEALIDGLELDGIPTTVVRSADAVHDVCILRVWDEHERDRIWDAAVRWLRSLEGDRAVRQEAAVVGRLS
jgi:acetyl esterase/lipase